MRGSGTRPGALFTAILLSLGAFSPRSLGEPVARGSLEGAAEECQ